MYKFYESEYEKLLTKPLSDVQNGNKSKKRIQEKFPKAGKDP